MIGRPAPAAGYHRIVRWGGFLVLVLAACDASLGKGAVDAGPDARDAPTSADAPTDGPLVLGAFGAPIPVPGITPVGDDDPTATGDLLELYFNRSGDIYRATRATTADPWGTPGVVMELSAPEGDTTPEVSYDGLTIYLGSLRPGAIGGQDIWMSTRANRQSAWTMPVHVPALSSATTEASTASSDGLTMVLETDRGGNTTLDIYISTRATTAMPWGTPAPLAGFDSSTLIEGNAMLSPDGLTLYANIDATGNQDLVFATRASTTAAFGTPQPLMVLNSIAADTDAWIAPDGRTIMFTSDRDGTARLYQATR